jgi:diaminopimelate decarboxylase
MSNPFFTDRGGVLHVENISLPEIAAKFGTPTYVYSAAHIRQQYRNLSSAIAKALPADRQPLICFACKANSNLAILSLLQKEGCGLEIVSEGELVRGLKAGIAPSKIVSTGVGKQASEIEAQLKAGIHQINIESLPELEHIQRIAAKIGIIAHVVFRLNPDVSGGGHDKISTGRKSDKFGMAKAQVFKGFAMAKAMSHVNAVGLSVHIGSQVFDVATFKVAFEKLPHVVAELRAEGYTVDRLDIGGGFPIQYNGENLLDLDAYAQWVNEIIVPLNTQIILEPGRYLVGNGGILLTEVLYIKETADRSFLIIDGAMNDLVRPAMYDAYHGLEAVSGRDKEAVIYDVVGPVCESSDIFGRGRSLPRMAEGDLVAVMSAGAYGYCMASNYNTRGRPAEILVDGDKIAEINARELYDDLLAREHVPEWLA